MKRIGLVWKKIKGYSLKKKIVLLVVVLVIGGIGIRSYLSSSSNNQYNTTRVSRSTITELVTETGTITATGRTDIYSPTNGTVEEVSVLNGDAVAVGQKLFVVKSTATEQEKDAALATYLTAKNTLDTANATAYSLQATMFSKWDTFRELATSDRYENSDGTPKYENRALPEFHIAEKEWLASESNYKKQQLVIDQAKAAVASTYLQYQATQNAVVKATTDGTILNISVIVGSAVTARTAVVTPTPLGTIANLAVTEIEVPLSENMVAKVDVNQRVSIGVNAVHGKIYKGVVRRVDTIGNEVQGVTRYNAYIEVLNPDNELRPGMNVDATITTKQVVDALSLPNEAVKPYQGGYAVRVAGKKNGDINYISISIGIRGKERTEILRGVAEGKEVITSLSNEQIKRSGIFGN